jgi:hypothetical protein
MGFDGLTRPFLAYQMPYQNHFAGWIRPGGDAEALFVVGATAGAGFTGKSKK